MNTLAKINHLSRSLPSLTDREASQAPTTPPGQSCELAPGGATKTSSGDFSETNQISARLKELASFAAGIIPSTFYGPEPEIHGARDIATDLELIAAQVDRVFAAYGDMLERFHVINEHENRECFRSPVSDAILGNATFLVENGTNEWLENKDEAAQAGDYKYAIQGGR